MMIQCHHQILLKMGFMLLIAYANEADFDEFVSANSTYFGYDTIEDPILFSQKHVNDLIRDLCLSMKKAELLVSRLKEQNMAEKFVKVSY